MLRYDIAHPQVKRAKRERAARDLYTRLRAVMNEAVAFAATGDQGGRIAIFMTHWPATHLGPLLEHAAMDARPKDWGKNVEEPRALLAKSLDDYNLFDLPPADGGGSSFLDNREMAIVSLLVGNWPKRTRASSAFLRRPRSRWPACS